MAYFSRNIKNKNIIVLSVLTLIIIFCHISGAEEEKPAEEKPVFQDTKVTLFFHRQRSYIGKTYRHLTQKIDEHFFRNKTYAKPQQDKLMLRLDFLKEKNKNPVFTPRVTFRVYFPRVLLTIDNSRPDRLPNKDLIDKDTKIDTSLSIYLREIKKFTVFFGVGITVRGKEAALYSRFNLLKYNIKIKYWGVHFRQSVFWYSDDGYGELTQFDFDYRVSEKMLLQMISAGLYSQVTKGFEFEESFIVNYDLIKEKKYVFWRISAFAHTEPFYDIDKYRTDIVYRVMLIKTWLFFDVGPQLEFPAEDNYKGIPGIRLGIDAIF